MLRKTLTKMFVVGATCVGLALLASGLAWSRGSEGPPRRGGGPLHEVLFMEKHAERLGLDGKTLEKIRNIVAAAKVKSSDVRTKLHEAHMTMRELLSAETPDEAAVMGQAERIGAIRNDLAKHHLRVLLQIRPLLTAEQVQELGKIREERRSRRRRWGPPHGGAGFGEQRGPRGMDLNSKMSRLTERLNLTEEQQTQIRSILEAQTQKMQAMKEEAKKLHQETDAQIQGVLTDEQRVQFTQFREERQGKMREERRHGGWGRRY